MILSETAHTFRDHALALAALIGGGTAEFLGLAELPKPPPQIIDVRWADRLDAWVTVGCGSAHDAGNGFQRRIDARGIGARSFRLLGRDDGAVAGFEPPRRFERSAPRVGTASPGTVPPDRMLTKHVVSFRTVNGCLAVIPAERSESRDPCRDINEGLSRGIHLW